MYHAARKGFCGLVTSPQRPLSPDTRPEVASAGPASIHPNAIVEPGARLGRGTRVWAFVHVLPGAVIGDDCNVCDHVFIENDVVLGNRVTVKCGISLWDGVRVEDDVHLGPNVVFTNDRRPRSRQAFSLERTVVRSGASVGANATLLPGVTIGRSAMVGAGSVVTRDVPDFSLVTGNPARLAGYVCVCGERLRPSGQEVVCAACGQVFQWDGQTLTLART
jgi:acetyltransferase-like isoleucine patch superfamily enzyme